MNGPTFKVLPDAFRDAFHQSNGKYAAQIKALLDAQTIFVLALSDQGAKAIRTNITYHDRSRRLVVRKVTVDGEAGKALWLVPRDNGTGPA